MAQTSTPKPVPDTDDLDLQERSDNEELVTDLLCAIGDDPDRPGLHETPARVVRSWRHLFSGYDTDPSELVKLFKAPAAKDRQAMVVLRDIDFYSMCEHHMLPFSGKAAVAYIPNKHVIGVSKMARIVDVYSRRLQLQERIGTQVVDLLSGKPLNALGVACILKARHHCMMCRGVEKAGAELVTTSLSGVFFDDARARQELYSMLCL